MIYLGGDHAGFELKEDIKRFLASLGHQFEDLGPFQYDSQDDYPDYALKVCRKVLRTGGRGVLICGTGQGTERVANKIPGIHAALCWNEMTARTAREHGDTNVLNLGARTTSPEEAKRIVRIWLDTPFSHEARHIRRIEKIKDIERQCMKSPDCIDGQPSTLNPL